MEEGIKEFREKSIRISIDFGLNWPGENKTAQVTNQSIQTQQPLNIEHLWLLWRKLIILHTNMIEFELIFGSFKCKIDHLIANQFISTAVDEFRTNWAARFIFNGIEI